MATNQYNMYSASFVYAGPTTLTLTQLRSQSIQIGANKTTVKGAGALDPGAIYTGTIDPRFSLSTRDLNSILGAVSLTTGLNCTGGGTLRFQKREQAAAYASGSDHETISTTKGFLCLDSFGVDRDSVEGGEASLMYVPLYDGTNAILVQNTGVSFSGVTAPAAVSAYYLGPVYHNGTQLAGLISSRVRTGINFQTRRTDGDVAPQDGFIAARDPMIELTFSKVDLGSTLSLFGTAAAGNIDVYYLRGTVGGRLATGSGDLHCKITAAASAMGSDTFEVTGEDNATVTATVRVTGTLALDLTANLP